MSVGEYKDMLHLLNISIHNEVKIMLIKFLDDRMGMFYNLENTHREITTI